MVGRSGWSTISDYFTINKTGGLYSLIKSGFFFLAGRWSNAKQQANSGPAAAGLGLHTSHVLFFSSADLHFPVRGKTNNTWTNACWICWSGATLEDVDSSSHQKLPQSEQALARIKWFVVAVGVSSSPAPVITEVITFSFEFNGELDQVLPRV